MKKRISIIICATIFLCETGWGLSQSRRQKPSSQPQTNEKNIQREVESSSSSTLIGMDVQLFKDNRYDEKGFLNPEAVANHIINTVLEAYPNLEWGSDFSKIRTFLRTKITAKRISYDPPFQSNSGRQITNIAKYDSRIAELLRQLSRDNEARTGNTGAEFSDFLRQAPRYKSIWRFYVEAQIYRWDINKQMWFQQGRPAFAEINVVYASIFWTDGNMSGQIITVEGQDVIIGDSWMDYGAQLAANEFYLKRFRLDPQTLAFKKR